MSSAIKFALILPFFVIASQGWCQNQSNVSDQAGKLSAGPSSLTSTAQLVGLTAEIDQLKAAPQNAPAGSPEKWTILWLHQRIFERVTIVAMHVDATLALIDNEIARATEVRGYLADRRDTKVTRANLFSALIGGGLNATSDGLQLSSRYTNASVATGIAGGAISAGLAIYGIHAQRGGTRTMEAESNMLAQFFGRPELATSHYPAIEWQFLNQVPPIDPDHLTRRERLIRTWLELKRLDPPPDTPAGQIKIEHITSTPDQHLPQTIDDLEDRIAMLGDVRARLSYLKRDLAVLLESLPEVHPENF